MASPNSMLIIFTTLLLSNVVCQAQLSTSFYDRTCPKALHTIRKIIIRAVIRERRMAASLIRLHFHDCFVKGCEASVLLDQTLTIQSEKLAFPNINSARGFEVIEAAKAAVEKLCPRVVSCADILTLAARDSSDAVGGPSWQVKLGRRDSTMAYRDQANIDLPSPFSDLNTLISSFAAKGLNTREMVALSGAHTIGLAQCFTFRTRIYANGADGAGIDPDFAATRRSQCPLVGGDSNLAPLDLETPTFFDNKYYKNLRQLKGLLKSDQVLFNNGSTDSIVTEYSTNSHTFASDFANAMVKMSEIEPLLAPNGIIRRVCNETN